MKTSTYVKSTEVYKNQYGQVTFVRVELGTGHKFTCHPDQAPKAGEHWDVIAVPAVGEPLPMELSRG